jgi:hypothetical protein
MKNMTNYFKIAVFTFFGLSIVSCNKDIDEPSYPGVNQDKPMVTLTWDQLSIAEKDDPSTPSVDESQIMFTLTSDRLFNEDLRFMLALDTDNSTGSFDDVEFSSNNPGTDYLDVESQFSNYGYPSAITFVLPANTMSAQVNLSAILDDLVEGSENLKFKFYSAGSYKAQVPDGAQNFEVTIAPKSSNTVEFTFSWDQTFDFGGTAYSLCEIAYDNDYLLFDSGFGFVEYAGASSDCPETYSMDLTALADGDYYIYQNLYDNAGLDGAGLTTFSIPTTVDYYRGGSATLAGTFVQNAADAFDSDSASGGYAYVVTVNINNDVVTLTDDNGPTVVASGRFANIKQQIQDKLRNSNLRRK